MNGGDEKKRRVLTLTKNLKSVDLSDVAKRKFTQGDNNKRDNFDKRSNNVFREKKVGGFSSKNYDNRIQKRDALNIIEQSKLKKKTYDEQSIASKFKSSNKGSIDSNADDIKLIRPKNKNKNSEFLSPSKKTFSKSDLDVNSKESQTTLANKLNAKKRKSLQVDKNLSSEYLNIFTESLNETKNTDQAIKIKSDDIYETIPVVKKNKKLVKKDLAIKRLGIKKEKKSNVQDNNTNDVDDESALLDDYHKVREESFDAGQNVDLKVKENIDSAEKNWKLSLNQNMSDEERQRVRELINRKQRRGSGRMRHRKNIHRVKKIIKVQQNQVMTPNYLASLMGEKNKTVDNVMHSNQINLNREGLLAFYSIEFIVETCGHSLEIVEKISAEDRFVTMVRATKKDFSPEQEKFVKRSPVVTIMGHVDHGKTSLLDYFRNSRVIDGEAGGITQHIGAYKVQTANGNDITFLDTPGHEAFSKIRARGANVTDIVLLIVAADDGVMPQTIEAINHIKAAKVPMLVVINKIDRPNANIEKLTTQLSQHEIISDEWGGEHIFVKISAKNGENIDELEENIILQAEMDELQGNPGGNAVGVVLETKIHPKKGYCATLLIQKGELKVGDNLIAGTSTCTVRNLVNDIGRAVKSAAICEPVEVFGFDSLPENGEYFAVIDELQDVRDLAAERIEAKKKPQAHEKKPFDFFNESPIEEKKTISFIVKADTQGSLDAIVQSIGKLETDEMEIKIAATGVGILSNSDVDLAKVTNSRILVFNTKVDNNMAETAKNSGIEVWKYNIIYNIIDDINALINNVLGPRISEIKIGEIVVKKVFGKTKSGSICGCIVKQGVVKKLLLRVLRNGEVIYDNGSFRSLRKGDEDVDEVRTGFECGLIIDNFFDAQEGDRIHVIERIEESR